MICDECKRNEACVHITQIGPNGSLERNLCEHCAAKFGGFSGSGRGFTVNDFLKGIFRKAPQREEAKADSGMLCPNCGMSYADFEHTGKIGCSVCYTTFRKQLLPLLKQVNGSSAHAGKIPQRSGGVLVVRHEIALLKEQLKNAVQSEEYEKAAEFRDKIRLLEQQLAVQEKEAEQNAEE